MSVATRAPSYSIAALAALPSGTISLLTSDHAELSVDKELLMSASRVFQDMLSACDTPNIHIDETREDMSVVLEIMKGAAPAGTYDTHSNACWKTFKEIMCVADKYDMPVVKERCEKMLISRCLRGHVRFKNFRFKDIAVGMEWLQLCQKYSLRDLGWYIAYDLGCQLQEGLWRQPTADFLKDLHDPDFLKVIIEAAADAAHADHSIRTNQALYD